MKTAAWLPLMIIVLSAMAYATAPPPSPTCFVKGTITAVESREAGHASCLDDCPEEMRSNPIGTCCPTDTGLYWPARYYLAIKINDVSYVDGSTEYITCETGLPVDSIQTIFIDKDKTAGDFVPGQQITGIVPQLYFKYFESLSLGTTPTTTASTTTTLATKTINPFQRIWSWIMHLFS